MKKNGKVIAGELFKRSEQGQELTAELIEKVVDEICGDGEDHTRFEQEKQAWREESKKEKDALNAIRADLKRKHEILDRQIAAHKGIESTATGSNQGFSGQKSSKTALQVTKEIVGDSGKSRNE